MLQSESYDQLCANNVFESISYVAEVRYYKHDMLLSIKVLVMSFTNPQSEI